MKILFLIVDFNYVAEYNPFYSGSLHLGVALLSSSLKKEGFKTELFHLLKPPNENDLKDQLRQANPDLVALTSFSHQIQDVSKLARWSKEELDVPTILGGVHATLDPESSIRDENIDMICIGEGEKQLTELCRRMLSGESIKNVGSIWLKQGGRVIRNDVMKLNEDLDPYPFADWELFNYEHLNEAKNGQLSILTARGCPHNCSYCSNHRLRRVYPNPNRYVRLRSVDNVLREVKQRIRDYPFLRYIAFLDDLAGANKAWLREFADKYASVASLPIAVTSRVEVINDDESFRLFKKIGVREVSIGLESGNGSYREEFLNRKMADGDIVKAVKRCREQGIRAVTANIIGLPMETMSLMLDTVKLNARAGSDDIHLSIFQPYPHTDLYELALEKGFYKEGRPISTFFGESVLQMPQVKPAEIDFVFHNFNLFISLYCLIGKFPKPISSKLEKWLDRIFLEKEKHRKFDLLRPLLNSIFFPLRTGTRMVKVFSPGTVRLVKRVFSRRLL